MLHRAVVLAIALGCASTTSPAEGKSAQAREALDRRAHDAEPGRATRWGIMAYSGDEPAVFASSEWPAGTKLRAHRIGRLTESMEVTVGAASASKGSPLFDADGENGSVKHSVAEPHRVPRGAIWVCAPTDWTVRPIGPHRAALQVPGEEAGIMTTALKQEGVEVTVEIGSRREKLYFHLGYDVQ